MSLRMPTNQVGPGDRAVPAPGPRPIALAVAAVVAALALVVAGCGEQQKDPIDEAADQLSVSTVLLGLYRVLAGEVDGDPIAITREYVVVARDAGVSKDAMLREAVALSESGCEPCAQIVSEAANSMG